MKKLNVNLSLTLEKMNVSMELIDPKVKDYLCKVEISISEKFSMQEDIINQFKGIDPL